MFRYYFSFLFLVISLQNSLIAEKIHEKVLICGVCRDVATRLPYSAYIVETIGKMFDDYQILIYENNSIDETPDILKSWKTRNSKLWYLSENLSYDELKSTIINTYDDGKFFIPEQIARARNIVLEKALSDEYENFDYVIWMDLDFVRDPDYNGFIDTFNSEIKWDAVFAYGVDPRFIHWDWYAFRNQIGPLGPELLGDWWWKNMPRQFFLRPSDPWAPVFSAFGGCGIYRKKAIKNCRYSAVVTKDLENSMRKIICNDTTENSYISYYKRFCKRLNGIYNIAEKKPDLPKWNESFIGFKLFEGKDPLIWRMNSRTSQYPTVCEHVTFHASMREQGFDKLYINPKLIFRYGD